MRMWVEHPEKNGSPKPENPAENAPLIQATAHTVRAPVPSFCVHAQNEAKQKSCEN